MPQHFGSSVVLRSHTLQQFVCVYCYFSFYLAVKVLCLLCYSIDCLKLLKQHDVLQSRFKCFKIFLKSLCNLNQYVMERNKHILTVWPSKK
jgi:hypothetical protein